MLQWCHVSLPVEKHGEAAMKICGVFLLGMFLGAAGYALVAVEHRVIAADKSVPDLQSLAAEIEAIKGKLPGQAHAMQDVGYHFSNLWFAGQKEHWDLAHFYWGETRSHLRWAVRIIPKRKHSGGSEVDLAAILQAVENSPLKQIEDAIKSKDKAAFENAYRFTIDGCYSCHKASEKAYLRPQIPTQPETPIINFDPSADWPK
jgi:hypothetical protein